MLPCQSLDDFVRLFPTPGVDDLDARLPVALLLRGASEPAVEDNGNAVPHDPPVARQHMDEGLPARFQALALVASQHVRLPDQIVAVNDEVHGHSPEDNGF